MERYTVRLRDDQAEVVSELRRVSVARRDVPEVSESAVVRELLDHAMHGESDLSHLLDALRDDRPDDESTSDVLADELLRLVPEHTRVEHERERVKRRNRVADLRGGFRGRVSQALRRRFENGYDPVALRGVAEGYRAEARVLWPDDEEARQAAVDHVNSELAGAVEAAETSDLDPASTDYSEYGGVSEAEAAEEVDHSEVAGDAERLLGRSPPGVVVRKLSRREGVTEEDARRAVEEARNRLPTDGETAATDGGASNE